MTTQAASPSALIPLCALASLLVLASPPAPAQLPPAIQADRLLLRAEREIQEGDFAAAAAVLEQIMEFQAEHGLEMPNAFWFKRGQVAQEAGLYQRALESAFRYLEIAGQQGEHYRAALELLDIAELELKRLSSKRPDMVVITAGAFRMGCLSNDDDCDGDELPVREVTIQSFSLSKHEVTFDEWDACVAAGGCGGYRPDDEGWGRGERPVVNVSWEDAQSYVSWLSEVMGYAYRLPTESEWEYAARAGTETKHSWGNGIGNNRANCNGCGSQWDDEMTAPVGSFGANAFGLHDMHGNVREWVEDCWHDGYEGAPSDGSAWLSGECVYRVLRSGAWALIPSASRSAARWRFTSRQHFSYIGFRVARTLTP